MSNDKLSPGARVIVSCYDGGRLFGFIKEVYLDRVVVMLGYGCATVSINDVHLSEIPHHEEDPVVDIMDNIRRKNKCQQNERSHKEAVSD